MPFLLLPASLAAVVAARRRPRPAALLGAALGVEVVVTQPDHISHFSWLIGGPVVGHKINLIGEDWGQDIGRFGAFAQTQSLSPLHYVPYGHIAPMELESTGALFEKADCDKSKNLRGPGFLAVHASKFVRREAPCGPIPVGATPDMVFQRHIFVFRLPDAPAAPTP